MLSNTDKIDISTGTLYFISDDGTVSEPVKVNDIDVEFTEDTSDDISFINLKHSEDTFTFTAKTYKHPLLELLGIRKAVLDICPNKRVTHLATHHRKRRTKIKNFNRAIRILESMGVME